MRFSEEKNKNFEKQTKQKKQKNKDDEKNVKKKRKKQGKRICIEKKTFFFVIYCLLTNADIWVLEKVIKTPKTQNIK